MQVQKYTQIKTGSARFQIDSPGGSKMFKKHMGINIVDHKLRANIVI